jgi:hypothetical protein
MPRLFERCLGVFFRGGFAASSAASSVSNHLTRGCRYVALNTLLNSASTDLPSVQRHRAMIVECVKDADTTIRRRALDLVYCLVSTSNVEVCFPSDVS